MFKRTVAMRLVDDDSRRLVEVSAEAFATAMNERVDVLIVGAGASGAAFAWSMAEHEDADPLPGAGRMGASPPISPAPGATGKRRQSEDFAINPNRTGRWPRITRSTRTTLRSRSRTSTASAAARSSMPGTFPACIRRISGSAPSTASPMTGRSTTPRSSPSIALNDRMMGVAGLGRRSRLSPQGSRRCRRSRSAGRARSWARP